MDTDYGCSFITTDLQFQSNQSQQSHFNSLGANVSLSPFTPLTLRNIGLVNSLIVKLAKATFMPNLALRSRYDIFKVTRYKASSSGISEKDEKFLQSKGSTFQTLHNKIPILLSVISDVI